MTDYPYATRLNSFRVGAEKYWPGRNGKITKPVVLERVTKVKGLSAVDLTKRGLDGLTKMGGNLMTLWMGQHGYGKRDNGLITCQVIVQSAILGV